MQMYAHVTAHMMFFANVQTIDFRGLNPVFVCSMVALPSFSHCTSCFTLQRGFVTRQMFLVRSDGNVRNRERIQSQFCLK
jgi:hypothetical protein